MLDSDGAGRENSAWGGEYLLPRREHGNTCETRRAREIQEAGRIGKEAGGKANDPQRALFLNGMGRDDSVAVCSANGQ